MYFEINLYTYRFCDEMPNQFGCTKASRLLWLINWHLDGPQILVLKSDTLNKTLLMKQPNVNTRNKIIFLEKESHKKDSYVKKWNLKADVGMWQDRSRKMTSRILHGKLFCIFVKYLILKTGVRKLSKNQTPESSKTFRQKNFMPNQTVP